MSWWQVKKTSNREPAAAAKTPCRTAASHFAGSSPPVTSGGGSLDPLAVGRGLTLGGIVLEAATTGW